jgi:hypothetical protein
MPASNGDGQRPAGWLRSNRITMDDSPITLRITGGVRDSARVSVRREQFSVGRPIEFDHTAPRVAAIEYALGAAGAEIVNGLRVFAARRRLEIDAVEAVVTAELEHALVYLEVIGESGRPAIQSLHIKVFVACGDESAVRELFNTVLERLPLTGTLRAATRLTTELVITS